MDPRHVLAGPSGWRLTPQHHQHTIGASIEDSGHFPHAIGWRSAKGNGAQLGTSDHPELGARPCAVTLDDRLQPGFGQQISRERRADDR